MKRLGRREWVIFLLFCWTAAGFQPVWAAQPCVFVITGDTVREIGPAAGEQVAQSQGMVALADVLLEEEKFSPTALASFSDGSEAEVSLQGFLAWQGGSADFLDPDGNRRPGMVGIWLDPPERSITQLMPEALVALSEGRVLIILLDGLGYFELMNVQPPFLASRQVEQARTVYPPISPVALGSIVTGELPSVHGITERGERDLKAPDLFSAAAALGRTAAMVEGSTKLVNTSIRPLLNPDLDADGSTDGEVLRAALEQLEMGVDLVFVHFHGYDDAAHTCGPFTPEAAEKLLELDRCVARLCEGFAGTVFVLADHGQHPSAGDKLGDHGEFCPLDLTIPWVKWRQP